MVSPSGLDPRIRFAARSNSVGTGAIEPCRGDCIECERTVDVRLSGDHDFCDAVSRASKPQIPSDSRLDSSSKTFARMFTFATGSAVTCCPRTDSASCSSRPKQEVNAVTVGVGACPGANARTTNVASYSSCEMSGDGISTRGVRRQSNEFDRISARVGGSLCWLTGIGIYNKGLLRAVRLLENQLTGALPLTKH